MRRAPTLWACGAVVALVVAVGALTAPTSSTPSKMTVISPAVTLPSSASSLPHKLHYNPADHHPSRSIPVSLSVPALRLHVSLVRLGLNPDHTVEVPATTAVAGWYDLGPTPGQLGAAVILGHVDSYKAIGVFYYLKDLVAGDVASVRLADGVVAHFTVVKVVEYAKATFPDRLVYTSPGAATLRLITCGGAFNSATGSYESNIVVYARFVSVTPA